MSTEQPSTSKSAFDLESMWPVLLIQLTRIYDLQLAFLSSVNPKKAAIIEELHARGQTFCPAPKFIEYEEEDGSNNDLSSMRSEDEPESTS